MVHHQGSLVVCHGPVSPDWPGKGKTMNQMMECEV